MPNPIVNGLVDALPKELLDIKLKLLATDVIPSKTISGAFSIFDQAVRFKHLIIQPGGALIFENLDFKWLVLYVDLLDLNGKVEIRRTNSVDLNGADGTKGPDGKAAGRGYGVPGGDGIDGQPGKPGKSQRIPELFIFSQQIRWKGAQAQHHDILGQFSIFMPGYIGGEGGNGGRGGKGTNGTQGQPSRPGVFLDCRAGPGYGGRGGNGGRGGMPGVGGNGSDGGAIYMFVQQGQERAFEAIECIVTGGAPGKNGKYGDPGQPGQGGEEGVLKGRCNSAGRKGADGKILPPCNFLDVSGYKGLDGPYPALWIYTGFAELKK